jgi:hypothetical protein
MSQLAYPIDQNAAILGMLADSAYKHTDSKIAKGAIPVGRGVTKVIGKDNEARLPSANQGSLVFAGDLITANVIDLDINDVAITSVTFTTDHLTTMGLLATEIASNADVATAVLDPADTNNRTLIVTGVDGTVITITNIVVTLGASQTTGTWTSSTRDALYGIAHWTQALEGGLPGEDAIPQYDNLQLANVLRRGALWVQFETAFDPDTDSLYCRFVEGASDELIGQFRNDSDSGAAFAVAGNFAVKTTLTAAGLGIIEINKPV